MSSRRTIAANASCIDTIRAHNFCCKRHWASPNQCSLLIYNKIVYLFITNKLVMECALLFILPYIMFFSIYLAA
jgi:hypothetical protein